MSGFLLFLRGNLYDLFPAKREKNPVTWQWWWLWWHGDILTAATAQTRPPEECLWQVWKGVPSGGD